MKPIANHDAMRSTNLLTVFHCVCKHGPITKKEIQTITGLSWGTVSNLTSSLLQKGIMLQTEEAPRLPGRTPKGIEINSKQNLIIGIDINLQGITGVVLDLRSQVQHELHEPIKGINRTALMNQSKNMIRRLISMLPDKTELKGIGVSFPGQIDREKGVSIKIHHFEGFENYPICEDIRNEFNVDVIIEHDPNCIAIAAHSMDSAQDVDNFVLLRACMGIGMGIYNKGILKGQCSASGEVGHTIVQPGGEKCLCGNHGCLEAYASADTLLKKCKAAWKSDKSPILKSLAGKEEAVSLSTIRKAAQLQDPFVLELLEQAACYVGIAIANVINIIDPSAVVVCGSLLDFREWFFSAMVENAKKNVWRDGILDIRILEDPCRAAAVGAASILINKVFFKKMEEVPE